MAANKEKQGCLSLLFPFLGLKSEEKELPYKARDDFLSPAELSFYKVLSSTLGTRFTVQSKVRLADIFFVARPEKNITYFNRISQRHLDFLICDSMTMKPLMGIELDDSSHQRNSRQRRDEFVDNVFWAADLPLVRFPVRREYNTREIVEKIAPYLRNALDKTTAESPTPVQSVQEKRASVPLCPKCNIPMVLRTVSQGPHKGKQFYGCPNYPRCREYKPVPVQQEQG